MSSTYKMNGEVVSSIGLTDDSSVGDEKSCHVKENSTVQVEKGTIGHVRAVSVY